MAPASCGGDDQIEVSGLRKAATMQNKLPSYLVDTDVLRNGRVSATDWYTKPLNAEERKKGWGNLIPHRVAHMIVRPKKMGDAEKRRRENRPYVAAIAKAAFEQKISLFTSPELDNEQFRQKIELTGFDVDVFQIVNFQVARSPATRGFADTRGARDFQRASDRSKDEQLGFLADITAPRFLELRKYLGDAHLADTFHYWTAEANGLDGFVTMERRFPNAFNREARHFGPKCRVLSPADVCRLHGIEPIDVDENINTKLSGMDIFAHTPVPAYAALGLD